MAADVTDQVGDVRSDCSRCAVDKPVEASDHGYGVSNDKGMDQSNKSLESLTCTEMQGNTEEKKELKMAADVTDQVGFWWSNLPTEPGDEMFDSDSDFIDGMPVEEKKALIDIDDGSSSDGNMFWRQAAKSSMKRDARQP